MKRIVPILLLVAPCLPVLFESCKKPDGDPVTPGNPTIPGKPGENAKLVDARFITFVHSAQEPNSPYGGALISTLHIYTFDGKGVLAGMTGTYLSYTKVNKAALDNTLTTPLPTHGQKKPNSRLLKRLTAMSVRLLLVPKSIL